MIRARPFRVRSRHAKGTTANQPKPKWDWIWQRHSACMDAEEISRQGASIGCVIRIAWTEKSYWEACSLSKEQRRDESKLCCCWIQINIFFHSHHTTRTFCSVHAAWAAQPYATYLALGSPWWKGWSWMKRVEFWQVEVGVKGNLRGTQDFMYPKRFPSLEGASITPIRGNIHRSWVPEAEIPC